MEAKLLNVVGQIAGIGGIALGVFLLLFRDIIRKKIFPQLSNVQAFQLLGLVAVLVWSVALVGIAAWVWTEIHSIPSIHQEIRGGNGVINIGKGKVKVERSAKD